MQTFKRIHEKEKKFKVDPRFKAVLTDDRFRAIDGECTDPSSTWVVLLLMPYTLENAVISLYNISSGKRCCLKKVSDPFGGSGKYDKYGKKLKKSSKVVDDLKAFYTVDDEEDEEDENEDAGAGQSGEKTDKGKKHAGAWAGRVGACVGSQSGSQVDHSRVVWVGACTILKVWPGGRRL